VLEVRKPAREDQPLSPRDRGSEAGKRTPTSTSEVGAFVLGIDSDFEG